MAFVKNVVWTICCKFCLTIQLYNVIIGFYRFIFCFRKRPTIHELLDHPWISLKMNILPSFSLKSSTQLTPKSTPISQRKSFSCITDTPKNQCKTFRTDNLNETFNNSTVRTYTVSANCLCPQCDTTCRKVTHTPVTKTTIPMDRGILC